MNKIEEAVRFALHAHEGAVRKGTAIPYVFHPLEAASVCAQMTTDEDVIAAAVLHDVLEDTPYTADDLRERFGDRITALVQSCSENKRRDRPASETWELRKQETLDHLAHAAREEKLLAFADKLSNLRATVNDYIVEGQDFWQRFQQKDPEKHLWYYTGVYDACEELEDSPLYTEYARLLGTLRSWIEEYRDFGAHDPNALKILSTPGDDKWVFQTKLGNDVLAMTDEEFRDFVSELRRETET